MNVDTAMKIIVKPYITEKTFAMIENENKICFIVDLSAKKPEIAEAVKTIFEVEVAKVNVRNTKHGKHASVKLAEGYDAEDAAMRLGAF